MIDFLKEIPGPQFLMVFLIYATACIYAAWSFINSSESKKYLMPPVTGFSSITIAVLRGGWKTVLEAVLYGLWKKDLIDLKHVTSMWKGSSIEAVRKRDKAVSLNSIENLVYNYFQHKKDIREAFTDRELQASINDKIVSDMQELQAKQLLKNPEEKTRDYIVAAITLFAIYLVGITKLYLGFMREKPVGYLLLILIITPFAVFFALKPGRPQTALGVSYLELLKNNYDWMKEKAKYDDLKGIDPALVAAVFGVAALSTDTVFANAMRNSTGSYGGCGGAGCGGASCGGGGCGGGGCGGCGG